MKTNYRCMREGEAVTEAAAATAATPLDDSSSSTGYVAPSFHCCNMLQPAGRVRHSQTDRQRETLSAV